MTKKQKEVASAATHSEAQKIRERQAAKEAEVSTAGEGYKESVSEGYKNMANDASEKAFNLEVDAYAKVMELKGIKVNKAELEEILSLKQIRETMSGLKKQEEYYKDRVMEYAPRYPGFVEVSQNKDTVKTDWQKVCAYFIGAFHIPQFTVDQKVKEYTEVKEGAKVLKVKL